MKIKLNSTSEIIYKNCCLWATYSFVQWTQTLVTCEKVSGNSTVEDQDVFLWSKIQKNPSLAILQWWKLGDESIIELFKPKKRADFSPVEMQCFENHKNMHGLNRFEKKNGTKTSPDCCVGLISSFRQHLDEVPL